MRLLFKKLKDIYEGKLALGFGEVKDESPRVSLVEKKRNQRGYGKDSEPDELQFTFKQLKERCNTKKRKASNDFGLYTKEKATKLEPEEDELDLMEPLSSLKSKISKSRKSEKKSRDRRAFPSFKNGVSIKEEPITITGESVQCTSDFLANTVRAEDSVPEYLESHITSFATDAICIEQVESGEASKDFNCELKNKGSIAEECGSCTMNSMSYEHLGPVADASLPFPVHILPMEVNNQEKTDQDSPVLNVPQFSEGYIKHPSSNDRFKEVGSPAEDLQSGICNISQFLDESMEANNQEKTEEESSVSNVLQFREGYMKHSSSHENFKRVVSPAKDQRSDISPVHDEIMEVDNAEKMEQESSFLNVPQIREGSMKHLSSHDSFKEVVSPLKDHHSQMCNISPSQVDTMKVYNQEKEQESSVLNVSQFKEGYMKHPSSNDCPKEVRSCVEDQLSDMCNISPVLDDESMEVDNGAKMKHLSSDNKLIVVGDDPPIDVDTQPHSSVAVNIEMNSTNEAYPSCNVLNSISKSETRNPPGGSPSTKKAIAPTSDERLCLAMNSAERDHDIDIYKCREKFLFGKYKVSAMDIEASDLSLSPQKNAQVFQTKSAKTPKEIFKKQKNFKRGCPPTSGVEGPHLSRSFPRIISTGCTSIQGCSESAIAFSLRQMHDIDTLATKLMSELKSVKEIVERKLLFEAYRSTSLKNDADEVKDVVRNAEKVEETSRKWLSMMAKDCNRFCKIMKLSENGAAVPAPEIPIQREKKVTFADEAGGTLCQVKLLDPIASSIEPITEISVLQAE